MYKQRKRQNRFEQAVTHMEFELYHVALVHMYSHVDKKCMYLVFSLHACNKTLLYNVEKSGGLAPTYPIILAECFKFEHVYVCGCNVHTHGNTHAHVHVRIIYVNCCRVMLSYTTMDSIT